MAKTLHEMLYEIDQDLDLLNSTYKNDNNILMVFSYAFSDVKWNIPDSILWKDSNYPETLAPHSLIRELVFLNNFYRTELTESKLLQLFVTLLETLDVKDTKILLAIKDRNLKRLYPRLYKSNVVMYDFYKNI